MNEKGLTTQAARTILIKLGKVEEHLARMQEAFNMIARRAFEIFEGSECVFGRDLEHWFQAEAELFHPVHLELTETETALQLRAEVPGFSEVELEVTVEPHRLIIAGTRELTEEKKEGKLLLQETCADSIFRVVDLPVAIRTDQVKATLRNGILEFVMPKAEPAKKVRVEAKAA